MVADPGGEHGRASLLLDEELRFQLDRLAGPRRELLDRRFHELFEQRVRMHPDAVAAVHRDQQEPTGSSTRAPTGGAGAAGAWAAPRGRGRGGDRAEPGLDGLRHRDLQGRWGVAADRAVLAGRWIATTLARAECTLVLTEPGSITMLDKVLDTLPGVQKIIIEEACAEGHADDDSRPGPPPTATERPSPCK